MARAGSGHPARSASGRDAGHRSAPQPPGVNPARLIRRGAWLRSCTAGSRIRPIVFNLSAFKLLLNNTVYLWLIESKNFAITDKQGHSASHVICIFKDQDFFLRVFAE